MSEEEWKRELALERGKFLFPNSGQEV